ncbi:hypothetical protein KUW17_08525 [Leisingera aquaemixtae]|uniref:hypothetical protein n=1 Tax=Leisingera aquaemixtae TaxID=1396826 RepID=UPI001C97FC45|nr:hypothetical protein [Leisingera aquaemixtae]MBY6066782.1 hypothetical protein [Leisingera aquaemixtae]
MQRLPGILGFFLLAAALAAASASPSDAGPRNKWSVSCGTDKGAITRSGNTWTFKTSSNHCVGGTFNQRAEINTRRFSATTRGTYRVQTFVSMRANPPGRFDIMQIHDGRNGCAPPLKIQVQSSGEITFDSAFKSGSGGTKNCVKNRALLKGGSPDRMRQDGTEYKLDVIFDFDGNGGFDVIVFLDDRLQISGTYSFVAGKGYREATHFRIKHGVYSKQVFQYEMRSRDLSVKRVRLAN